MVIVITDDEQSFARRECSAMVIIIFITDESLTKTTIKGGSDDAVDSPDCW